jgi:AraC-like DNA-binding protein
MEKEKLEEINKIKKDFFTSVSHELKTPLSLIIAPLKYISQYQELSPKSSEHLEVAVKNTDKMLGLINELVTFNKVESGNFQFYIQKGNPLDFIENVAKLFRESINGWGLGLALVKRFTDIHKSNISVESTIGKGSCFVVSLNVSESAFDPQNKISLDKTVASLNHYEFDKLYSESALPASLPVKKENTPMQASILLVEDSVELLKFLSDIFTPDIIKGYKSGAEAYVQKPFDPQILELQVKNIIQIKQSQREKIVDTLGSDVESVAMSKYDKEFINKINDLIEKNIQNDRFSIAEITQILGISRSVLHVKMKNLLNISMGDYIRKKRLNKACELLSEGYNVSETTWQTGFSDPNYFSKCIKKEFGVRPTDYKSKQVTSKRVNK